LQVRLPELGGGMNQRQPIPGVCPPFRPGDRVRVPWPGSKIGGRMLSWVKGEPVPGDEAGDWAVPVSGAGLVPVGMVEKT
jgi:hypothetical protein